MIGTVTPLMIPSGLNFVILILGSVLFNLIFCTGGDDAERWRGAGGGGEEDDGRSGKMSSFLENKNGDGR